MPTIQSSTHLRSPGIDIVFVEIHATGRHPGTDCIGLHEAVIARRRIEGSGESMIIESVWPEDYGSPQVQKRMVVDEYARLVKKYDKDQVVAVYGEQHTGRLKSVCDRIIAAFVRGIPVKEIIELGKPENDGLEFVEQEEKPRTRVAKESLRLIRDEEDDTTAGKQDSSAEDDDKRPTMGAITESIASDSQKLMQDALSKLTPEERSAVLAAMSVKTAAPTHIAGIEDAAREAGDAPTINGNLIEHLKECGWNEPDSMKVARLVSAKGIDQIADPDLSPIASFKKADARKALRQHLKSFTATQSAPPQTANAV